MVYGELGRYPLFVNDCVWNIGFRVLKMDDIRIPKQAYKNDDFNGWKREEMLGHSGEGLLSKNGFYCVWLQ